LFEKVNKQIYEYKQDVSKLRQEIQHMENKINYANEETEKTLGPFKDEMYNNLILAINNQKEENSKLQNQLSELKKEKGIIQQKILEALQKIAAMEEEVGNYN